MNLSNVKELYPYVAHMTSFLYSDKLEIMDLWGNWGVFGTIDDNDMLIIGMEALDLVEQEVFEDDNDQEESLFDHLDSLYRDDYYLDAWVKRIDDITTGPLDFIAETEVLDYEEFEEFFELKFHPERLPDSIHPIKLLFIMEMTYFRLALHVAELVIRSAKYEVDTRLILAANDNETRMLPYDMFIHLDEGIELLQEELRSTYLQEIIIKPLTGLVAS